MDTSLNLNSLVRPNIQKLKPYRSARDDFKKGILLDANENPFPPVHLDSQTELNRYPDPHQEVLRSLISGYRNTDPERIFTGNGSDEAIDLLIRIFCRPGIDKIVITPPTYGMYRVSADIHDVEVIEAPLKPDFSLEPQMVLEKAVEAKIIFLCSPNNPTANLLDKDAILQIIQNFSGIVVVDEAYLDFAETTSLIDVLDEYPNLVILQTLSKAFGLAGIRLGMAFASVQIIAFMMKVKPPYNVNVLTQRMAVRALGNPSIIQEKTTRILEEKRRVLKELSHLELVEKIHPSDANFLLVKMRDAQNIYHKLAKAGVVVRYRGDQLHCEGCLRITIGTQSENDRLLSLLKTLAI
jgi:histidinol-phosphate aminotransferase